MTVIILGASSSGKTTLQNILVRNFGFKKCNSYTTREPRPEEIDGVDYFFVTEEEIKEKFKKNEIIELKKFNKWFYGNCPIFDTSANSTDYVCILTPSEFRKIKAKIPNEMFISFFMKRSRASRLISSLQRGDNVDEAIRRNMTDEGLFDGIESEVDYTIEKDCVEKTFFEIAEDIVDVVKRRSKGEKI